MTKLKNTNHDREMGSKNGGNPITEYNHKEKKMWVTAPKSWHMEAEQEEM